MRRIVLAVLLLLVVSGCSQPQTDYQTRWVLYTMDAQAGGEYLWKALKPYDTGDACRAAVRERAQRGPLAPTGLIAWYTLPNQSGHWVGCLPDGYDPYERR